MRPRISITSCDRPSVSLFVRWPLSNQKPGFFKFSTKQPSFLLRTGTAYEHVRVEKDFFRGLTETENRPPTGAVLLTNSL